MVRVLLPALLKNQCYQISVIAVPWQKVVTVLPSLSPHGDEAGFP